MSNKNEVFEYLIDQLRQQVNNNQCEDLANEVQSLKSELARYKKPYIAYVKKTDWVQGDSRFLKKWGKHRADILRECIQEQDAEIQSLKNQLRDASELVAELQSELQHQIDLAAGVYRWSTAHFDEKGKVFKVERGYKTEQSGCRKEDTQGCPHSYYYVITDGSAPFGTKVCKTCGGYF